MIKKALLVAGVVFALYTIFIHRVKPHWRLAQPRENQKNQFKAEQYLYTPRREPTVVVGSSLAAYLDAMPGTYNLSFSGMSPLDGLALVTTQQHPLRTVLVEMNFIDRAEDPDFTDPLTNPILMPAKRALLPLRAGKQPLAVVSEQLQLILSHWSYRFTTPTVGPASEQLPFLDQMIIKQRNRYAQRPAPALLARQLSKLRQAVTLLAQRDVQVIFYEMPVDYRLCDLPRVQAIRGAFRRYFPPATYAYVYVPTCAGYVTTDGLHLDGPSATRYTNFLQNQIARLRR